MSIGFWTSIQISEDDVVYYWSWEKPFTIKDRTYFYSMRFTYQDGFKNNSWSRDLQEKQRQIPETQIPEDIREEQQNKFNDPLFELEVRKYIQMIYEYDTLEEI